MTARGKLTCEVASGSSMLRGNLPIEVRDSAGGRVGAYRSGESIELPAGLYTVTALLGSGHAEHKVARVVAGESEALLFGARPRAAQLETIRKPARDDSHGKSAGAFRSGDFFIEPEHGSTRGSGIAIEPSAELAVRAAGAGRWVVTPRGAVTSVPWVRLRAGKEQVELSVPINPLGHDEDTRGCVVEATEQKGRLRVSVSLAPARQVSSALKGLMESGSMLRGVELARDATDLLASKYSDPSGAALGALLLHRIGMLEERASWLRNLARDFAWLPDARVLEADLLALSEKPAERARGLAQLLAASGERMMFAETLAIAMSRLRRWPGDERAEERSACIEALAETTSRVDWSAVVLTTRG